MIHLGTTRVFRPPALRTLPLDSHLVIEASAGTGKTFTLENLVVELVLSTEVTLDRLLCVTFTERATQEIRSRVRAKLESLLLGGGDAATDAQMRDGDCWAIDDGRRRKLELALHAFDGATIATIHGFCHRVLRENAFASGRCFEETQVDGREAFGRALRDALREELACDPRSVRWIEAALRGGWSMARIEKLLWDCAREHSELRPRFDPAALDASLAAFPIDEAREPRLLAELKASGTKTQTARAVVEALASLAGLVERARTSGDPALYVFYAKDVVGKLRDRLLSMSLRAGRASRVVAAALDLTRATPPFAAAVAHALFGVVQATSSRSKRAAGRFDFDDMLLLVDEALRGPGGTSLAEAMRRRWRYALIDEFQDTDAIQWSIFRRAFFERPAGTSHASLILVGDPKQSIYRFRGADVETYLTAGGEVLDGGGARVCLESNYRSTALLVDACNRLFDSEAPEPIFTGDIAYARVSCGRPERQLVDGDGRAVSPLCAIGLRGELRVAELGSWIAREMQQVTNPARPWRLDGRPLEYGDAFVVTRTRAEALEIGAALRAARVPYALYKEDGLFQTDEARDLRTLLAAVDEPDQPARQMAAWLTPFFALPLADIERARRLPAAHPLVVRLRSWNVLAVARDFDRLFASIVSDSCIVRRELFFSDGERKLTNYLHLLEILTERARAGRVTLADLVQELSGLAAKTRLPLDIEGGMQRLESDRTAVQVMTIHKSKGLEAALVFVAGGATQPSPDEVRVFHENGCRLAWVGSPSGDVRPIVEREEREEEERLMYVAITRAMGRVYLPYVSDGAGTPKSLRGPYAHVHRRLAALIREEEPLLTVVDVTARLAGNDGMRPPGAGWTPNPVWLRDKDEAGFYARLRSRHAPTLVTSYTRMRDELNSRQGAWREGPRERSAAATNAAGDPSTTLRASRASGVFLHELLERVPLTSFATASGFTDWRTRGDVCAVFDEGLASHRIDPRQRAHAERMVWSAYTTPMLLPGGQRLEGFAAAARIVREMEFAYPLPGHAVRPERDGAISSPTARGYVRGSLDVAFEHAGLTYFVDWKSDSLGSYAPDALAEHVASHYGAQAKLYTLAVVKLLDVHSKPAHDARFGGLLYCFLRGFDGAGGGLWSARPSFGDLATWENDLRDHRAWGAP